MVNVLIYNLNERGRRYSHKAIGSPLYEFIDTDEEEEEEEENLEGKNETKKTS